jgi:hypothetical protein
VRGNIRRMSYQGKLLSRPRPAFPAKSAYSPKIENTALSGWAGVFRAATHLAVWAPFVTVVAVAVQRPWRVVGDGAVIALHSWNTTMQLPLVGQPTALGQGLYDPGPLQYWLLAAPVHLDPARGVLWGAAVCCMAAASLTIEAAWSVLGRTGGVAACGTVLVMIARAPGIAAKPFWNPWFGAVFFLAALAAGWAVMSGRRWWFPVLVVTGSVAAQAHLMFALASAALVPLALIVGLVDASWAKAGYRWALTGLAAGIGCWAAPFIQQLTSPNGNLAALVTHTGGGRRTGLAFALNAFTAATRPLPLWWPLPRQHFLVAQFIHGRTALFAVVVLVATAAVLAAAVSVLRCRPLASLAAVSLVTSVPTLVMFSHIPFTYNGLIRVGYLLTAMFLAGMLIWLTIGWALVLTGRLVIKRRQALAAVPAQQRGRPAGTLGRWAAHGAGAAVVGLIVLATLPGVMHQLRSFPEDARSADKQLVTAASRRIHHAVPSQPITLYVLDDRPAQQYVLQAGLAWALTGAGYHLSPGDTPGAGAPAPQVIVLFHGGKITVAITTMPARHPLPTRLLSSHPAPAARPAYQTGDRPD